MVKELRKMMPGRRRFRALLPGAISAAVVLAGVALRDPVHAKDSKTASEWSGNGLRLELEPLLPDQVRAFFVGRGFSTDYADLIAREGCIFRSAIGSAFETAGSPMVAVRLDEWRVILDGAEKPLRTREQWSKIWQRLGVDEAARVAFFWALFPTRQEFGPTDYNWGMLAFGLPPGARFDVDMRWQTASTSHKKRIERFECGK